MTETETHPPRDDGGPRRGTRLGVVGFIVALGAVIVAAIAWAAAGLISPGDGWDVEAGKPVEVVIEAGSTARTIYAVLEDALVARSGDVASAAERLGVEDRLQAGSYILTTDMDPEDVVRQLVAGPNSGGGDRFTVVEGWTVDRIIAELATATGYSQAEFQRVLRGTDITSPYLPPVGGPIDSLNRWEGLLYPATYQLTDASSPGSILGAMADETARRLSTVDWSRLDTLGVSRYEAIIIASLIEREAGTDSERPTISSVIHNRLAEPMRLQIDATVIYALGYNPGRVTAEHLRTESPWNTYRVDGLPPTPIGSPSLESIRAAADPATTTYLFYVLGSEDGSHLFAETYEGHQLNIADARSRGVLP
ncbi:MAG TPA: endolytic transglycosylase MltG [Acidimicrobiia bacterium]|nr:endolytic transglycosylase MltG [Acidimicrobiia bacterium]